MDYTARHMLGITEKTEEELHDTISRFEAKWKQKAHSRGIR